jgi:SAM-dependent methyltransferase
MLGAAPYQTVAPGQFRVRNRQKMSRAPDAPSAWVELHARRVRKAGTVLDLACGAGRHTRYLRRLGFPVVAVDVDVSGVGDLVSDAFVEVIEADLEAGPWPLGHREFDGIVVTNYLHRPLLPKLVDALAPEGVLIYETFAVGNEKLGRPRNPRFLLERGELLETFGGRLTVVDYSHGFDEHPSPAVRQRICAKRSTAHAGA